MKFRHILSLGGHCEPSWHLRRRGMLRHGSPFDWLVSPLQAVVDVLADDGARLGREFIMRDGGKSTVCAEYGVLYHHEFARTSDGYVRFSAEAVERCRSKLAHKMARFIKVCERAEPTLFLRMGAKTPLQWDLGGEIDVLAPAIAARFPALPFRVISVDLPQAADSTTWKASDADWDAFLGSIQYDPISEPADREILFGI